MGSLQGTEFFDNNSELYYPECISLFKMYFLKELPDFIPEREYYDPKGYWGVFFVDGSTEIFLGSERSFFAFTLKINGSDIYLPKIDHRLYKLERTSRRNILFLLDFIKEYLMKLKQNTSS